MTLIALIAFLNSILKKINNKYDLLEEFDKSYKELVKLYYLTDEEYKKMFFEHFKRSIKIKSLIRKKVLQ